MITKAIALALPMFLIGAQPTPVAAESDRWAGLRFLVGEWTATGGGAPGASTGSFSFTLDLGGKILTRKNHSPVAPGPGTKPVAHDDLMLVYPVSGQLKAIYFDNEGHVIEYAVTTDPGGAAFESPAAAAGPHFRLRYDRKDKGAIGITFAFAPPGGGEFQTYVSGVGEPKEGR